MTDQNKETTRRLYEAISAGRIEVLDDVVAEDFVDHEEMPGVMEGVQGRERARQVFTIFRTAFPDVDFAIEDMIAEDDKVFARLTMTGTHRGDFMGLPATNHQITVPFADSLRFENGRIAEHWGVTDTGQMMQQLGMIDA